MSEATSLGGDQDQLSPFTVQIGDFQIPQSALGKISLTESLDGNMVITRATITMTPPEGASWDYRKKAQVDIYGVRKLTGICTKATVDDDESITLELAGIDWMMDHSLITSFGTFGMSDLENLYWFQRIITPEIDVEVEGLTPDPSLRPFMYAVPVKGLIASGTEDSVRINDSGIASGDWDDLFRPLLDQLTEIHLPDYWGPDNPKIFGVVLAHDLIEAEALSIDRANRTLDLISFACRCGISHFTTRRETTPMPWDASAATAPISLHPCILVREYQSLKGWIRDLPGIEAIAQADLTDCRQKIELMAQRLSAAHKFGEIQNQQVQSTLSDRQQKLFAGVQRALRWLTISANEQDLIDQFIASWTALESVLDAAEYPRFFGGSRSPLRDSLRLSISQAVMPPTNNPLLSITSDMIGTRLLRGQWPLIRRLSMFASAFGIELNPIDIPTVGKLYGIRSSALHTGKNPNNLSKTEVEYVQALVQRLVLAASVGAYKDIEPQHHTFQIGQLGPEGGAAPIFMDGKQVPYQWNFYYDKHGHQVSEITVEGTIHDAKQMSKKDTS